MANLKSLEGASSGQSVALNTILDQLAYNEQGLIAAIAQDHSSQQVLMLAWMDRTAIERTINEGYACYFSRSRQTYWRKGETSGHLQQVKQLSFDCDGDAVLLQVEQTGPACHTNRLSCFYLQVDSSGSQVFINSDPVT